MFDNFNNGMIDYNSVQLIIGKIELHLQTEKKIVSNLSSLISELNNYYQSNNNKVLDGKKNNLIEALNSMLENRSTIINYLNKILNSYLTMDEKFYTYYQKKDIN